MNYKNAWRCKKCPQSNTSDGCPVWWEYSEENSLTGETRINKGCGFSLLPQMLVVTINMAQQPAREASQINETIRRGFVGVSQAMTQIGDSVKALPGGRHGE